MTPPGASGPDTSGAGGPATGGPATGGPVTGPVPAGRDAVVYDRMRRRLLWSLPTGLYVLGSRSGEDRNLMTISWVTQVATRPKLVAVSVEAGAVTRRLVEESGRFAVTLLPRAERALVRRFVKPVESVEVDDADIGTMHGEAVVAAPSGVPVLRAAAGWLDCAVREQLALGSHVVFVGEVSDCGFGYPGDPDAPDGPPEELLRMEDTRMSYGG